MTLSPGTRVGPYEVIALIGKGGMGEVYRVHDARLGRSVAIKILSLEFTADPDRLKRFEREARMLAALNHPRIATIHGVEDAGGITALVMELVDGVTLAELIARGPVPVATALRLAGEIADALDAAHEKGIVHRDLKPSNIKITSAGGVKVLDFGLAKEAAGGPRGLGEADAINDASRLTAAVTIDQTQPGLVLGTAAYMSPEQARGHEVDKRTDIWAFGCVLFEMLTGRSAFARPTVTDTLAAVLEHEPDWAALPADTPPGVARVLRKCLEKDQRRRLRDLGDWDLAIEPIGHAPARGKRLPWIPWAAALAACVGVGVVLLVSWPAPRAVPPAAPVRFDIPAGIALSQSGQFSVSPDGRHLVFAGTGDDRMLRLWIKSFDAPEVRPLPGTEAEVITVIPPMFWSPDSQSIAFFADGKIKKVSRSGGVTEVLCDVPSVAVGGSWNRQDVLIVGNAGGGLVRCNASGGMAASAVTTAGADVYHLMPSFLPDGRRFIYLHVSRTNPSRNGLYLGDLELPPDKQSQERLVATGFGGAYVPGNEGAGYLLFVRDEALFALPFDAARLAIAGEPQAVAAPVGGFLDTAFFAASPAALIYRSAVSDFQLTWLDRRGTVLGRVGEPGSFSRLALSPEGTRAVVVRENRQNRADQDLWMVDLVRNTTTRFTADPSFESAPTWSADGTEIWYAVGTGVGEIYRRLADGTRAAEVVLRSSNTPGINPATSTMGLAAASNGSALTFTVISLRTKSDLWILLPGGKPVPLIEQDFDQTDGHISPDGRWIAYVSNESGADEVFVRALTMSTGTPALGAGIVVSRGGGKAPRWRADGRELLYQTLTGTIMAAPIVSGSVGTPTALFRSPGMLSDWGVSPDGQRLLVAIPTKDAVPPPFTVVFNWQTALR